LNREYTPDFGILYEFNCLEDTIATKSRSAWYCRIRSDILKTREISLDRFQMAIAVLYRRIKQRAVTNSNYDWAINTPWTYHWTYTCEKCNVTRITLLVSQWPFRIYIKTFYCVSK